MATVCFYEKPGCQTNARQKRALRAAGHAVEARDLLAEPWTPAQLLSFLEGLPVIAWFNRNAPAVKSGAVDPTRLDREQALQLLTGEPLLIRRPLMSADGHKWAGFDHPLTGKILLPGGAAADAENCSQIDADAKCPIRPKAGGGLS